MPKEDFLQIPAKWEITYVHSAGVYATRFFEELKNNRKIYGVRCPLCRRVLIPPRPFCERCFIKCGEWVEVGPRGVVESFTICYEAFTGLPKPPYCVAVIRLDGADTGIIHRVGGIDLSDPKRALEKLRVGTRVEPVFAEEREGRMTDILYFKPVS